MGNKRSITPLIGGTSTSPLTESSEADDTSLQDVARANRNGIDTWYDLSPEQRMQLTDQLTRTHGQFSATVLEQWWAEVTDHGRQTTLPEWRPDSPVQIHDAWEIGDATFPPSDVRVQILLHPRSDGHMATTQGHTVFVNPVMWDLPPDAQRDILIHEAGHLLSEAYPPLQRRILENPEGSLGRTHNWHGYFDGLSYNPEESWATAFSSYHSSPDHLETHYPQANTFVDDVLHHVDASGYIDAVWHGFAHMPPPSTTTHT